MNMFQLLEKIYIWQMASPHPEHDDTTILPFSPTFLFKPRNCNHEFRHFLPLIFWSLLTRRNQFVHILTDFYGARYMRELSAGAAAWILELNMVDIKCGFRNLHNSIFPYISLSPSSTPTKSTKQ